MPPALVAGVLADARGDRGGLPLFTTPVISDEPLARRLWRVHALLLEGPTRLEAQELLMATVLEVAGRHAGRRPDAPAAGEGPAVARVRDLLRDRFAEDLSAARRPSPATPLAAYGSMFR